MKQKIKNEEISSLNNAVDYEFPKYATQIINLVNNNAQGTRPNVVGQMSELIQEFPGHTLEDWIAWYSSKKPEAIENATDKIYSKFLEMKEAMEKISRNMINDWVKDLLYNKTYCGLRFQSAIIAKLSQNLGVNWRIASVDEEAKGIDGFVGSRPVQIKPASYKLKSQLAENINIPIVYYEKDKDGIVIDYNPSDLEQ